MDKKQKDLTVKFDIPLTENTRELSKTGYELSQRFKDWDKIKVFPSIRRSHDVEPKTISIIDHESKNNHIVNNSEQRKSTQRQFAHRLLKEK